MNFLFNEKSEVVHLVACQNCDIDYIDDIACSCFRLAMIMMINISKLKNNFMTLSLHDDFQVMHN